jgi:hypothetical protein
MQSILEAYDLIRFTAHYEEKLANAVAELEQKRGSKRERQWLNGALELVKSERESVAPALGPLYDRAQRLPEMAAIREEEASSRIGAWVDSLEKLLAGITFQFGSRVPLIEALFPHQKLPNLRRAAFETAAEYAKELERRLKSSYVSRLLATDEYAFLNPVIEQMTTAWAQVAEAGREEDISVEERRALEEGLIDIAKRLEVAVKQARLLGEAAFVRFEGEHEQLGLAMKPKKRAARPANEAAKAPAAEVESAPPVEAPEEVVLAAPELVEEAAPAEETPASAETPAKKKRSKGSPSRKAKPNSVEEAPVAPDA